MEGKILFGKYKLGKLLGEGNFGKVYKSVNISTGEIVAIKTINKEEVKKLGTKKHVMREITVMSLVKHSNIVELKEVMATKTNIYLVMEFISGGELYTKVINEGKINENLARKLFRQILNAVDFCHSRGICHRDLKLENILLDIDGENLKIADFGLATLPGEDRKTSQGELLYSQCGALAYMAPEIIRGELYDGKKSDIWSCGVILFALVVGRPPFQDENRMRTMWKIRTGKYVCPLDLSVDLRDLIDKILVTKPSERITMYDIMDSAWFKKGYNSNPYESCNMTGLTRPIFSSVSYNAFDFIQLMASGLDLSSLLEGRKKRLGTIFITNCSTIDLVKKVEDLAKCLNFEVVKEKDLIMRIVLRGKEVGRMGKMVIGVQIFEMASEIKVVEFSRWGGDGFEYVELMEKEVRPSMKDVVWKWQGDWIHGRSCGESVTNNKLFWSCFT